MVEESSASTMEEIGRAAVALSACGGSEFAAITHVTLVLSRLEDTLCLVMPQVLLPPGHLTAHVSID